ncbi:unnamed protein product [Adineta steineri]|uniref:G-protein coupled receptors family 1 profile domain-containing protein n=1 Tax=Adineta steineri TaxID=433720 RepID=A0A814V3G5_9BILA|nr:unnamed protein product [Adineta steineri]CAF1182836.1 unnamed protein product [Adineta steineri]
MESHFFITQAMYMKANNNTAFIATKCDPKDDLGYNLIYMYRILFGMSCITVPLGILLNIIFVITIIFQVKKVFDINSHALLLSCMAQVLLAVLQGPIRLYFYYHDGCLPAPGSPLCELSVYLDHIPTQINNFLMAQLSIERFFLVVKPLIFRRGRHQSYSLAIYLHYIGLFVAIMFPCFYYPIIMQNGASTIDLDDPSAIRTCDLWYARDVYGIFDLLITFVPYFLILISCLSVISVVLYRKCIRGGQQRRQVGMKNHHRLLFALHLFLIWFLLTWSPWVLYDFFQIILNLTYSIYIDAVTTFIVYLNYTFGSTIVLLTFKEMRQFCFAKFRPHCCIFAFKNRIKPIQAVGPARTVNPVQIVRLNRTIHPIPTVAM